MRRRLSPCAAALALVLGAAQAIGAPARAHDDLAIKLNTARTRAEAADFAGTLRAAESAGAFAETEVRSDAAKAELTGLWILAATHLADDKGKEATLARLPWAQAGLPADSALHAELERIRLEQAAFALFEEIELFEIDGAEPAGTELKFPPLSPSLANRLRDLRNLAEALAAKAQPPVDGEARILAAMLALRASDLPAAQRLLDRVWPEAEIGPRRQQLLGLEAAPVALQIAQQQQNVEAARLAYYRAVTAALRLGNLPEASPVWSVAARVLAELGALPEAREAVGRIQACINTSCTGRVGTSELLDLATALARIGDDENAASVGLDAVRMAAQHGEDSGSAADTLLFAMDKARPAQRRLVLEQLLVAAPPLLPARSASRPRLAQQLGDIYATAQGAVTAADLIGPALPPSLKKDVEIRLAAAGTLPTRANIERVRREAGVQPYHKLPTSSPLEALSDAVSEAVDTLATGLAGEGRRNDALTVIQAYIDLIVSDPRRNREVSVQRLSHYKDLLSKLGAAEESSAQAQTIARERARRYAQTAKDSLKSSKVDSQSTIIAFNQLRAVGLKAELATLAEEVEGYQLSGSTLPSSDRSALMRSVVEAYFASGRIADGERLADRALSSSSGGFAYDLSDLIKVAQSTRLETLVVAAQSLEAMAKSGPDQLRCQLAMGRLPLAAIRAGCGRQSAGPVPAAVVAARPSAASPPEQRAAAAMADYARLEMLTMRRQQELASSLPNALALAQIDLDRVKLLLSLGQADRAREAAAETSSALIKASLAGHPLQVEAEALAQAGLDAPASVYGTTPASAVTLTEQNDEEGPIAILGQLGKGPEGIEAALSHFVAWLDQPEAWSKDLPYAERPQQLLQAIEEATNQMPQQRLGALSPVVEALATKLPAAERDMRWRTEILAILALRARGDDAAAEQRLGALLAAPSPGITLSTIMLEPSLRRQFEETKAARARLASRSNTATLEPREVLEAYQNALDAGEYGEARERLFELLERGFDGVWTIDGSEPVIGAAVGLAEACHPRAFLTEERLTKPLSACRREAVAVMKRGLAISARIGKPQSNRRLVDVAHLVALLDGGVPDSDVATLYRLAAEAEIPNPTGFAGSAANAGPAFSAPSPEQAAFLKVRDLGGDVDAGKRLRQVQQSLKPDEAMVILDLGAALIVRRDSVNIVAVSNDEEQVRGLLRRLRADLDPTAHDPAEAEYDVGAAHRLWSLLLEPLRPALTGARHLRISPLGVLSQMPFEALVVSAGEREHWRPSDESTPDWAILHFSFSTAGTLRSQAEAHSRPVAPRKAAFLGLGAPSLRGGGPNIRTLEGLLDAEGRMDSTRIARLSPLPDAKRELESMAGAVGGGRLLLGPDFTKARMQAVAWTGYGIIVFATHGFVAASDRTLGPVLVLSPTAESALGEPDVLTATEIRALKMDADLVVLSACDTGAVPDGSIGAGGFAEAFKAAGAKTVVVSRWPVLSETAGLLTLPMVMEAAQHGPGNIARAERAAILKLLEAPPRNSLRHPMFWAAFNVFGDVPHSPSE